MRVREWLPRDVDTVLDWLNADPRLWEQLGLRDLGDYLALMHAYDAESPQGTWHGAVEIDGELAAMIGIRPRVGDIAGAHVIVNPRYRGRGVEICELACATARGLGVRQLVIGGMRGRSTPAQTRWLARIGFSPRTTWSREL
jgi:GNAT superfamily N-acetyltransferase